jgi:hypothetical protein
MTGTRLLGLGGRSEPGDITEALQVELRRAHTPAIHVLSFWSHTSCPGSDLDDAAQRLRRWADAANARIETDAYGGGDGDTSPHESLHALPQLRMARANAELGAKCAIKLVEACDYAGAHARIIAALDEVNRKDA